MYILSSLASVELKSLQKIADLIIKKSVMEENASTLFWNVTLIRVKLINEKNK